MPGVLSFVADPDSPGAARAIRSLEQQGFSTGYRWPSLRGKVFASIREQSSGSGQAGAVRPFSALNLGEHAHACCVGPIWYRSLFGDQALRRLLEEFEARQPFDEECFGGNFALYIADDDRAWLLNDPLGLARIYSSEDFDFHSTSWLATRAYTGSSDIDDVAAAEYVLLGAVHSDRTVARRVRTLSLGDRIDLNSRQRTSRFDDGVLGSVSRRAAANRRGNDIESVVDDLTRHLKAVFGDIVAAFSDRIDCALSGGFDSRLIVAALLDQGIRPQLFVYGRSESSDVHVAHAVAKAERLDLRIVDKTAINGSLPSPDREELVRCALFFDGLPNDGIIDPGADRLTRLERSDASRLALNGGGGEIFRNFFHLHDLSFSADDLVRAFYRGLDPAIFRSSGALSQYQEQLVSSVTATMARAGVENDRLRTRAFARYGIEAAYPLFRCHHWMAVNNSLANRTGNFLTPLLDLKMVRASCGIPLRWKNAGSLESRMIRLLHPRIASHKSAYGFAFSDGPDWRARLAEWLTCSRPISSRPLISALGRSVRRTSVSQTALAKFREILPGDWQLDSHLDLSRLTDNAALSRVVAIEIVARELPP